MTAVLGTRMPALFIGHGSPMNAVADNNFTRDLQKLAATLQPFPKAIVVISAHWETGGTKILSSRNPRTIHDFWGFPDELYAIQYPAPGDPQLAEQVQTVLGKEQSALSVDWGLDHGAWAVLRHIYPHASVPVIQISLDRGKTLQQHFEFARSLSVLRQQGVLVISSGNAVHNLGMIDPHTDAKPFDWALEFDAFVKQAIVEGNIAKIIDYEKFKPSSGNYAVPTPEHYLPLIYTLAMRDAVDPVSFPHESIQNASVSMRTVRVG